MQPRTLIRVATCGSVDDGKSTFIGRLLYESNSIYEDQLAAIIETSRRSGETELNLALLTDGLRDERSQKITIDVAYRHFETETRRFLLADTPGHEQYTRNMFTGVSACDIAILLLDASRGITDQSIRHAFVLSLLQLPVVIVAVNKMDAVAFAQEAFERLVAEFRSRTERLRFPRLEFVPVSALQGANVRLPAPEMAWYTGPTVLDYLNTVHLPECRNAVDFRLSVQTGIRPNSRERAYLGEVLSGSIRVGERIRVMPSGHESTVARLTVLGDETDQVRSGDPCAVWLSDELDLARGDLMVRPGNQATLADRIEANVCWMSDVTGESGSSLVLRVGHRESPVHLAEINYRFSLDGFHRKPAADLRLNDLAKITLHASAPIACDLFEHATGLGRGILLSPKTGDVLGAVVITRAEKRLSEDRIAGKVLWMTGLSGAGKSTLSEAVTARLRALGHFVIQLDGDRLRQDLNSDLGFSEADRSENIRRTSAVAKLLAEQGATVICSLISPLAAHRSLAREVIGSAFHEVYVQCDLATAESRDPKGLYRRARRGEIPEFTGVSAPYEVPVAADLTIDATEPLADGVNRLLTFIVRN